MNSEQDFNDGTYCICTPFHTCDFCINNHYNLFTGVAELADAFALRANDSQGREGSTPFAGTIWEQTPAN